MKKNRDFRQSNKEKYEEEERGHGVILVSVMALLAVILAVVCVIAYKKGVLPGMRTTQADVQAMSNVQTTVQATASMTDAPTTEKWQEGDVRYNGKVYRYNMDLKTYLFMGIDRSGKVTEAEDSISGGQSDAMFLLVVDTANEKVSIISIHRVNMFPTHLRSDHTSENIHSVWNYPLLLPLSIVLRPREPATSDVLF